MKTFIALLTSLVVVYTSRAATPETLSPNVVFIYADDLNDGCRCGEEIARENHYFSPSSEAY